MKQLLVPFTLVVVLLCLLCAQGEPQHMRKIELGNEAVSDRNEPNNVRTAHARMPGKSNVINKEQASQQGFDVTSYGKPKPKAKPKPRQGDGKAMHGGSLPASTDSPTKLPRLSTRERAGGTPKGSGKMKPKPKPRTMVNSNNFTRTNSAIYSDKPLSLSSRASSGVVESTTSVPVKQNQPTNSTKTASTAAAAATAAASAAGDVYDAAVAAVKSAIFGESFSAVSSSAVYSSPKDAPSTASSVGNPVTPTPLTSSRVTSSHKAKRNQKRKAQRPKTPADLRT